jgi:preprotein translocase subunit SecF
VNLIAKRRLWYAISLVIIVPGTISLLINGLRLGIEFKGGQNLEVKGQISAEDVRQKAESLDLKDVSVVSSGSNSLLRYRDESQPKTQQSNHQELSKDLAAKGHPEISFQTVGPSVSRDITRNAILSVALASLAIVLYIAFAFRNIPPPMTSWQFGIVAIIAMLHDALLLVGVFSILGAVAGVEVDSLFITAVLTAIGFSVHDTIVVFDRIRENLRRERGSFEQTVNTSILETAARSLNTSLTVLLALLALYLVGGESIKLFVLALLVGIASGTYSSVLTASPLLVTWHNLRQRKPEGQRAKA